MLEGKAKELFEEWLHKSSGYKFSERELFYNNRLTPSMQWGVYEDFAESLGYFISVEFYNYGEDWDFLIANTITKVITDSEKEYENRQEARTAVIKKLNKLINQSN